MTKHKRKQIHRFPEVAKRYFLNGWLIDIYNKNNFLCKQNHILITPYPVSLHLSTIFISLLRDESLCWSKPDPWSKGCNGCRIPSQSKPHFLSHQV